MDRRFELYKLLPSGRSEAKPSQEIAKAARITDMRVFRHYIELLRKDGMVICSCNRGLFKPESRGDILQWLAITKARAKTLSEICESAERALGQIPGRQSLNLKEVQK